MLHIFNIILEVKIMSSNLNQNHGLHKCLCIADIDLTTSVCQYQTGRVNLYALCIHVD